jgi:hypothetical protein
MHVKDAYAFSSSTFDFAANSLQTIQFLFLMIMYSLSTIA